LSRRRIALVILGVVASGLLAWWWIPRPPAAPAAIDPPIDLEMPAERARLDAATSLARMPDDPWTFAESIPAAPAASAAKQQCGEDELPEVTSIPDADGVQRRPPQETRPGGAGYMGATRRVDAALRASADPFDRAVADALNIGGVLTPAARIDALVQGATTTTDPRIYGLAYRACRLAGEEGQRGSAGEARGSCSRLDAREWARRDPGNALPWLYVLDQATANGDKAGQREALQQMAAASRFDDRSHAAAGAVAEMKIASDGDLAAQASLASQALGMSLGQALPALPLNNACRARAGGDVDRAKLCESIGDVMFDHSDSMLVRALGGAIHAQVTGDESRRAQAQKESIAMGDHWTPATGFSACGLDREVLRRFRRMGKLGEVAAMKEELHGALPP
jgi:hypothetical protein